jgi:hypothetical protein
MTSDRTIQQQFEAFIESIFFHRNNILFGLVGVAVLLVAGRYVLMAIKTLGQAPLEGTVTFDGTPICYGTVTLVADDHQILHATITPDGRYRFPHVSGGKFRVAVSSPNPRSVFEQTPGAVPQRPTSQKNFARTQAADASDSSATVEQLGATAVALPAATPLPPRTGKSVQQRLWRAIPGHYANPLTSGLLLDTTKGGGIQNLTLKKALPDTMPE